MLFRKAELGAVDLAARSVPVVIATDTPVERSGYTEVLDMARCDLSRGDLPLIESHDTGRLNIGVVRELRVDGNKLRGLAVFGLSARSSEVLTDVQSGIVRGVSIGYELTDEGSPTNTRDGRSARSFGFRPYEVSAVAVPADTEAGFNRSRPTLSLPKKSEVTTMNAEPRNHAQDIAAVAASCRDVHNAHELATRAIQAGHTVEQFQQEMIRQMSTAPIPTAGNVDVTRDQFMQHQDGAMRVLRTRDDFEAHYRAAKKTGDEPVLLSDFFRGIARMKTTPATTRALSIGTDTAGGYTVPTTTMPEVLAALVPASSLLQAGAGIIPLDDGAKSYSFAAVDALPTAGWRLENGSVAESAPTFKNIVVTPRSLAFFVKLSRELLADAVNLEPALQQIIAQAFAKEIDRVGLRGTGTAPQPRGLLNTSGINAVTNGANGTVLGSYANLFSGAQAILTADAMMPTAAIMHPRSLVKLGALTDTTNQPLQVPDMLKGVRLVSTSQVPINLTVGSSVDCSEIYMGDFRNMAFGMRENLSVQLLDQFYAADGQIAFVCHARLDVVVLYPAAFALVTGVR